MPPAPANPLEVQVDVTVEAVVFSNADSDFAILRSVDQAGARVVLQGGLTNVHVGEALRCQGTWKEHPQHGWGFHVTAVQTARPHTVAGMISYLASAVSGIGPVFAKAIVDQFGEDTFERIDQDPSLLYKVRTPAGVRMGPAKIRAIVEAWEEQREVRKVMHFLSQHQVTPALAGKLYKKYEQQTIEVLQKNPYAIVSIRGVGFKNADRIALNLGIPVESPQRIQAGVVYCLQESEGRGHCFLLEEQLQDEVRDTLELHDRTLVDAALAAMTADERVWADEGPHGRRVYLPEMLRIERRVARVVADLAGSEGASGLELPARPTEGDFVPNDGQWQAVEHALGHRISLITGLPGTGKTTLVKLLLDVIDGQDGLPSGAPRYLLASPTGKAARRLGEATGREAQTLHRMLQWAPSQGGFVHDEKNPLLASFVIVDETSMVDLKLADGLLRAIGPATHLILVGDADQLAPVGAGKVFDDLITSSSVPSVRLSEVFRQAARSLIVRNAHQIVHGKAPWRNAKIAAAELELPEGEIDPDYFFVERNEPEEIADAIVEFAAERIPKAYGFHPVNDVLVLAPMKKGPCGLEELNTRLQRRLNPDGRKIGGGNHRVGDRIIQTRNDYTIEVMNGEVGVIRSWDFDEGEGPVDFGDREVIVHLSELDSFLPAYAISVHRAQGSQAPVVICAVSTSHYIMLTRSLINTAITRAQKLCVCVGQQRAMNTAVRTVDSRKRNSALAERVVRELARRRRGAKGVAARQDDFAAPALAFGFGDGNDEAFATASGADEPSVFDEGSGEATTVIGGGVPVTDDATAPVST